MTIFYCVIFSSFWLEATLGRFELLVEDKHKTLTTSRDRTLIHENKMIVKLISRRITFLNFEFNFTDEILFSGMLHKSR